MLATPGHVMDTLAMLSHRLVKLTALSSALATWSHMSAILSHMRATLRHRQDKMTTLSSTLATLPCDGHAGCAKTLIGQVGCTEVPVGHMELQIGHVGHTRPCWATDWSS